MPAFVLTMTVLYCPACNGALVGTQDPTPIFLPLLQHVHHGYTLRCTHCAAITEVDTHTGNLIDFPGLRVAHLYVIDNGFDLPHTFRTLRPAPLFRGRES